MEMAVSTVGITDGYLRGVDACKDGFDVSVVSKPHGYGAPRDY